MRRRLRNTIRGISRKRRRWLRDPLTGKERRRVRGSPTPFPTRWLGPAPQAGADPSRVVGQKDDSRTDYRARFRFGHDNGAPVLKDFFAFSERFSAVLVARLTRRELAGATAELRSRADFLPRAIGARRVPRDAFWGHHTGWGETGAGGCPPYPGLRLPTALLSDVRASTR